MNDQGEDVMLSTPPRWSAPDDEGPDDDFRPSHYFTPGADENEPDERKAGEEPDDPREN
jgi:hypothetical protein